MQAMEFIILSDVCYYIKLCMFTAAVPIMETPPQNVTVLDGKDATITCRAAGAPTPNITWIYQGMYALTLIIRHVSQNV
jgi:hypothetical protein